MARSQASKEGLFGLSGASSDSEELEELSVDVGYVPDTVKLPMPVPKSTLSPPLVRPPAMSALPSLLKSVNTEVPNIALDVKEGAKQIPLCASRFCEKTIKLAKRINLMGLKLDVA